MISIIDEYSVILSKKGHVLHIVKLISDDLYKCVELQLNEKGYYQYSACKKYSGKNGFKYRIISRKNIKDIFTI